MLYIAIRFLGLFNKKIRSGISGRKKLFEQLIIDLTGIDRKKKMVWFHSSSMGEFEQAKPIIERLREEKNINLIVTFFSPSGYLNSRNYPYADVISYLPFDTPALISRFISLVRPGLVIFMRYDFWPNIIWTIKSKKIPWMIVDATMQKNSKRKLPVAKNFHKSLFGSVSKILSVSQIDSDNFKDFGINADQLKAVGDTRFDRVYKKSLAAREKHLFKDGLFDGKKIFVFGSSWPSDEDVVLPAFLKLMKYDQNVIMILAPHEPTEIHLESIEGYFSGITKTIRFSYMNNYNNERVILIDSIGILLTLYFYADAAYVGGSFKQGIHNVLEPAVYGIPVLFGPKHQNSQEALKLVGLGSGLVVKNKRDMYRSLRKIFSDESYRNRLGEISSGYVKENIGATERILNEIHKYI